MLAAFGTHCARSHTHIFEVTAKATWYSVVHPSAFAVYGPYNIELMKCIKSETNNYYLKRHFNVPTQFVV